MKNITCKWLFHKQILPKVILGLGSLLIFCSWAFQNYYTQRAEEELVKIHFSRQQIAFNEINKNLYSIFINETQLLDTFSLDKSVYGSYAYCIYALTAHQIGLSMATVSSDEKKINENIYNETMKDLASWRKEKRIDKLMDFTTKLSTWEKENGSNTVGLYQTRFLELREEANRRANKHLALYLIGSSLLGIAFILQIKNEIEKMRVIEKP